MSKCNDLTTMTTTLKCSNILLGMVCQCIKQFASLLRAFVIWDSDNVNYLHIRRRLSKTEKFDSACELSP